MNADYFAYTQYKDYIIYKALAKREDESEFKRILGELIEHEREDFEFWRDRSSRKEYSVSPLLVQMFVLVRTVFGLTFTARFLEGRERKMIARYHAYLETIKDEAERERIHEIIKHERYHEARMIEQVKEERVEFMSNIVLGMNDGLIELTGALVGFAFALQNHVLVAFTGLITGVSASFSMAASAYMQARHEPDDSKSPWKAAVYTGISYLVVVLLLVAPYFVFTSPFVALGAMFAVVLAIVASVSFYSSVLFSRPFFTQFSEMAVASIGVAALAFVLGTAVRMYIGM